MKSSIERAFKISSLSLDKVDDNNWEPWGEKIYKRAKKMKIGDIYFSIFSLPSHAVHGNWQDLITYHLEYENGEFSPLTEWGCPRPQPLFAAAFLAAESNKLYLDEIIQGCPDKNQINSIIDDIIKRIKKGDELHEQFYKKSISKGKSGFRKIQSSANDYFFDAPSGAGGFCGASEAGFLIYCLGVPSIIDLLGGGDTIKSR